tara:strand:- start:1068 stop:1361 length:294 start_codon:yes stop_codon:yes gene_type:complete
MVSSKLKKKKKKPKQVEKTDAEEPVAAAPQETVQKRPRKKKKKPVLFGGESSIDRTPIPSTFWHRPPTSDVLAAKDDVRPPRRYLLHDVISTRLTRG